MADLPDPTRPTPSPAKAARWEALVRVGLTPDSATAQVQQEFAKADQWEALVASGLSPDSATARLNGPPPTATPAMAALLFGPAPGAPVLGSTPTQPPVGRTIAENQALANTPTLTPDLVHQQVAEEAARQGTAAVSAALDPTGAARFTSGLLSGGATAAATLPSRAAHGLLTLGAAGDALAARAVGRPDVATAIQTAALSGRTTAGADQATARIGQAIAQRLPVVGTPGRLGQFVGSQAPGVAAFSLGLPEAEAGIPALGRIAQMGTAGGIAGLTTQPENPAAGLEGVGLGAGGEALLQGIGALGSKVVGAEGAAPPSDAAGVPLTGDRRVQIPTPPTSLRRRLGDLINPQAATDRLNAVTGLPGLPVWRDMQPLADAHPDVEIVSADGRNLKKMNDEVSPQAADAQVRRQADAFRQASLEAGLDPSNVLFTPKGDELYATVPKGMGQEIGARAQALLGNAPVGHVPTGMRFGVGATTEAADQALNAAKAAEKAAIPPAPEGASTPSPSPLVYHGTDRPFSEFSLSERGRFTGAPSAHKGFFFSSSPRNAELYAGMPLTRDAVERVAGRAESAAQSYNAAAHDLASVRSAEQIFERTHGIAPAETDPQFVYTQAPGYEELSPMEILQRQQHARGLAASVQQEGRSLVMQRQAAEAQLATAEEDIKYYKGLLDSSVGRQASAEDLEGADAAAEAYAGREMQPRIIRARLQMRAPLVVDWSGQSRPESFADLIDWAQATGHDGVIVRNVHDPLRQDVHIVFEPAQIQLLGEHTPEWRAKIRGGQELGKGALPILGGTAGGLGAGAYGYATGTDPKNRLERAAAFGGAGLVAGAGLGRLAERAGEGLPADTPLDAGNPLTPTGREVPVLPGVQGPVRGPEATRLSQLGDASPETKARIENYARQQPGPGQESWDDLEARVATARAKTGGALTPQDIRSWRRQGLDRVQVGAMTQLLQENQAAMDGLARTLSDPGASAAAKLAAQQQWNALDRQSFDIFSSVSKQGGTEAGRNLAALKKVWGTVGQTDAAWVYRAQQLAERPLTMVERAKLAAFATPAERLRYMGTLRPQTPVHQLLSQWKSGLLTGGALPAKTMGDVSWALAREAGRPISGALDWLASLATGVRTEGMSPQLGARFGTAFGGTGREEFARAMTGLPSRAEEAAGLAPMNITVRNTVGSRALAGAGAGAITGAAVAGPGRRLKGAAAGAAVGGLAASALPLSQPFLNALYQGPFRLLKGVSNAFGEGAYRASLASQAEAAVARAGLTGAAAARARASLLATPTDPMQAIAMHDAMYDTMTDQTQLAKAGRAGQGLFGGAGNGVIPFNTTPASITTKLVVDANPLAAPYSLAGLARTMRQAVKEMAAGEEVSPATRLRQHQFVTQLGMQGVNSLPFVFGALAYLKGKASGTSDPTDRGARGLRAEEGIPDDAFQVGGQWLTLNRMGLPGMEAALGANVAAAFVNRDTTGGALGQTASALGKAGQAMGRVALDNPFFVGVTQAQKVAGGETGGVASYLRSMTGSVLPAGVRAGAAVGATTQKQALSPADRFTEGVPGQRAGLPDRVGIFGTPLKSLYGQGLQAFSPIKSSRRTRRIRPSSRNGIAWVSRSRCRSGCPAKPRSSITTACGRSASGSWRWRSRCCRPTRRTTRNTRPSPRPTGPR